MKSTSPELMTPPPVTMATCTGNGTNRQTASKAPHPYLTGNFAPVHKVFPLTACSYTGTIPKELYGGQYVRNGANPAGSNQDETRQAHWFDGDGMLTGVLFKRSDNAVAPHFVNQYVLTDVYIAARSSRYLRHPIPPSIAVLINPIASTWEITCHIVRTLMIVLLSHLSNSVHAVKRISVANTSILYHDGRALTTCESGPPMRVILPGLETAGWYDGNGAEGEASVQVGGIPIGGEGFLKYMREWTTAHPRVDPKTSELVLFSSTTLPPYVQYSLIPPQQAFSEKGKSLKRFTNIPVPGIASPKMMHDFGVSSKHTVIMDLPLSLNPLNLAKLKPVVVYDPSIRSRFGVFPRYSPQDVRWFETIACCIFHTANTWDDVVVSKDGTQSIAAVNMLACRLTSAALVFNAGNLANPNPAPSESLEEEEQCRLYYYQFDMSQKGENKITHQWALSKILCEFPTLRDEVSMSAAQYIYSCSSTSKTFGMALGRAVKVDALVKVDAHALIERGKRSPPEQITGAVDTRTMAEILTSGDEKDPIKVFRFPPGCYAQECRFVPRTPSQSEDDGWVMTYVFDEKFVSEDEKCTPDARSELWIIDARNMSDVVARVQLPQRVPYGLHGAWFSEQDILNQRDIQNIRSIGDPEPGNTPKAGDIRSRFCDFIGGIIG